MRKLELFILDIERIGGLLVYINHEQWIRKDA